MAIFLIFFFFFFYKSCHGYSKRLLSQNVWLGCGSMSSLPIWFTRTLEFHVATSTVSQYWKCMLVGVGKTDRAQSDAMSVGLCWQNRLLTVRDRRYARELLCATFRRNSSGIVRPSLFSVRFTSWSALIILIWSNHSCILYDSSHGFKGTHVDSRLVTHSLKYRTWRKCSLVNLPRILVFSVV